MKKKGIMIAAVKSGSGKTTITWRILKTAFRERNASC